jgi:hypothetical protein
MVGTCRCRLRFIRTSGALGLGRALFRYASRSAMISLTMASTSSSTAALARSPSGTNRSRPVLTIVV